MYVYVTVGIISFILGFVSYHATRTAVHEWKKVNSEQKNSTV